MKAEVVYERNDAYDMHSGPYGYRRVGFKIGNRVFWTGICGSTFSDHDYQHDEQLARDIVLRWNLQEAGGER